MEKSYVKSAIEGLKSASSSRVQESLLRIRSKITINDNGIQLFRECGGFDYLLPHLRKPNERILDITLSILGNCCLEEESSLLVGKLNCYGPLLSIIKTVSRDSIVGRACRVIGNLAQRHTNAEAFHSHGAVTALINLIEGRDKNISYPTLTMSVRAIRQLWMVTDKREEMLSLNAVRCIAILLTRECESTGIIKTTAAKENEIVRKSQEELITGILKCLGYFTTHAASICAEQIQGDGRGYQCLVALTRLYESLALKCLINLCYSSACRPLLGTAGLVECLVGILQKISGSYGPEGWPDGAARALAQLSGEAVNRARLRHCGGLPLLLAAARTNSQALHSLLQYVFDDASFQILVNEGLVNLLTDELTQHLATMELEHDNMENTSNETAAQKLKGKLKNTKSVTPQQSETPSEAKSSLFLRRKSQLSSKNEDELKVVIERDNMIVGFVDAVDSDAYDDSQSEDEEGSTLMRKCLKRERSGSPKRLKKKSQLIKMASKDWSAGVYWEPKSPEWPSTSQQPRRAMSSDRADQSPLSPYSDGNQSGFSPEYRGFSRNKRARLDWSPESGVSTGEGSMSSNWTEYQWSPSSSGPTSPFSTHEESSDSEISGRYSPVCSDLEAEAEEEGSAAEGGARGAGGLDTAQVAQYLDNLMMEDDDSVDEDTPLGQESRNININKHMRYSRIACVLVLLFRVSHERQYDNSGGYREQPVDVLFREDCLSALLDYVERCKRPLGRAARILAKVMNNALCLMSVLRHRLVLRLHNMSVSSKHPPAECHQCKQIIKLSTKLLSQLTILAESSYGIGEISYQLLKGSSSMKQTLSLTLPYIVRSEKPLRKFFMECSALNLLLSIIAESKEDTQTGVTALAKLATNLHIKDPKSLENRFKDKMCASYDPILNNLTVDEIVTFELDDLSTVKANKVFLCQNSEVFSVMLMGCFKESTEKCVRLGNVTKSALEYLLTLLHFGFNNPNCEDQIFPMADKLETTLEVLLLADRFLLEKLKELVSSGIQQFQLTPETADKIYVWSLSEGMGFLCVESVAYLLTGKMEEKDRMRSFQSILGLRYKDQWLDDIKSLILRQLSKSWERVDPQSNFIILDP